MQSVRIRLAAIVALIAVLVAACAASPLAAWPQMPGVTVSPPASGPAAAGVGSGPALTAAEVEARLRAVDPSLRLVPTTRQDDSGAYPPDAFDARSASSPAGLAPQIGLVLVYPSTAERASMQPYFGPSGMSGPGMSVIADGIGHSVWIGFENALVEVAMPGGTMGGRTPTPQEADFPERVRLALEAPS